MGVFRSTVQAYKNASYDAAQLISQRIHNRPANLEANPIHLAGTDGVSVLETVGSVTNLSRDQIIDLKNYISDIGLDLCDHGKLNKKTAIINSPIALKNLMLIASTTTAIDPELKEKAGFLLDDIFRYTAKEGNLFTRFFRTYISHTGEIVRNPEGHDGENRTKKYSAIADFLQTVASESKGDFHATLKKFFGNIENSFEGIVGSTVKDFVHSEVSGFLTNLDKVLDGDEYQILRENPFLMRKLHDAVGSLIRSAVPKGFENTKSYEYIRRIAVALHATGDLEKAQREFGVFLHDMGEIEKTLDQAVGQLQQCRDIVQRNLESYVRIGFQYLTPAQQAAVGSTHPATDTSEHCVIANEENLRIMESALKDKILEQTRIQKEHEREYSAVKKIMERLRLADKDGNEVAGIGTFIYQRLFARDQEGESIHHFMDAWLGTGDPDEWLISHPESVYDPGFDINSLSGINKGLAELFLRTREEYQEIMDCESAKLSRLVREQAQMYTGFTEPIETIVKINYLDPTAVIALSDKLGQLSTFGNENASRLQGLMRSRKHHKDLIFDTLTYEDSTSTPPGQRKIKDTIRVYLNTISPPDPFTGGASGLGDTLANFILMCDRPGGITKKELFDIIDSRARPLVENLPIEKGGEEGNHLFDFIESLRKDTAAHIDIIETMGRTIKYELETTGNLQRFDDILGLAGTTALDSHSAFDRINLTKNLQRFNSIEDQIAFSRRNIMEASRFFDEKDDFRHQQLSKRIGLYKLDYQEKAERVEKDMLEKLGLSQKEKTVVVKGLESYYQTMQENYQDHPVADVIMRMLLSLITYLKEAILK